MVTNPGAKTPEEAMEVDHSSPIRINRLRAAELRRQRRQVRDRQRDLRLIGNAEKYFDGEIPDRDQLNWMEQILSHYPFAQKIAQADRRLHALRLEARGVHLIQSMLRGRNYAQVESHLRPSTPDPITAIRAAFGQDYVEQNGNVLLNWTRTVQ